MTCPYCGCTDFSDPHPILLYPEPGLPNFDIVQCQGCQATFSERNVAGGSGGEREGCTHDS